MLRHLYPIIVCLMAIPPSLIFAEDQPIALPTRWEFTRPLVSPEQREDEPSCAQKDPTIVHHEGRWHLFMTVKLPTRSAIEYCSFENWDEANQAKRILLDVGETAYFCAPQVFYFRPHKKWYLIYQIGGHGHKKMAVACATTSNLNDPNSWETQPHLLTGDENDPRTVGGIDFWIICDEERAYLFFTSNNGKLWRMWTPVDQFPRGFDHCELAMEGPFFEASHTYRIKGSDQYLTLIEENGRRYYKAYLADRLDGAWKPLASTEQLPFAGAANIQPAAGVNRWTDNISHGELLRESNDERLLIDPARLTFLFQGCLQSEKQGLPYGKIPWRLGLLTPLQE
ncbi:MAG: hypothetical protein KDA78_08135 [Planctomycetaceae bacterium]|nr:hypothetical protein [Planctomycetaceae bacterium]